MAILFCAIGVTASLATYTPADPSFNHAVTPGGQVHNALGLVGAYIADLLVALFGMGGYLWAGALFAVAAGNFNRNLFPAWWRWLGVFLFLLCVISFGATQWAVSSLALGEVKGGGLFGDILHTQATFYLRPAGAGLLWTFFFIASIQLMGGLTWAGFFKRLRGRFLDVGFKVNERRDRRKRLREAKVEPKSPKQERQEKQMNLLSRVGKKKPAKAKDKAKEKAKTQSPKTPKPAETGKTPAEIAAGETGPPPVEFLSAPPEDAYSIPKETLQAQSDRLGECLSDFGIQGEVLGAEPGPVITMFEFKPAPGVKVSKIAGLSDDVALALKAPAVRIEAPIPGRDTVGFEIPNDHRQTVYLREVMESKQFTGSDSMLSLALGKDIHGRPHVGDLAKMPHLLVAGATGQGKSVCINSLLMSFLYKASPDDVKLLLVDPKRIELSVYSSLPHLVHPVVTDMALAKNALEWAVYEMEQRYNAMERMGVRNITTYNKKLKGFGDNKPEDLADLEFMPYLVIVIDELADLMLTAKKEVETSIVRLAQLARAAGIHMILATQRPSVDVVTGLIKANFPSRIAFTVTSPQDSRTILDTVGANHLLGKGDMLYKPGGGKNIRLHGALVDEEEIGQVIEFWKARQGQSFELDFGQWTRESEQGGSGGNGEGGGIPDDPVYAEAVQFVMEQGKASISLIQRRFRIGFNRAARYVEQMEQDGVVGPADGSKPRKVIK